ncbi:MAG: DUF2726 domain-containing protein [Chloroflexi bacterium]|nr:MAG: DUF2726 domain-containing protein [Chloroflexota bacterium]
MENKKKFGMLRRVLKAIGLSEQAAGEVIDFIIVLLGGSSDKQAQNEFPYYLREDFLSPAELEFYKILRTILKQHAMVFAKVNLNDIFMVKKSDYREFRIYTNKIDRKHVDFLICHPLTLKPIAGVELDDKSHQRRDRKERDKFVDGVFQAAGLPILHFRVQRQYDTRQIKAKLVPYIKAALQGTTPPPPPPPTPEAPVTAAPTCPNCGAEMVLRTAKKGANKGNQFWGCSNYPTCKTILQQT